MCLKINDLADRRPKQEGEGAVATLHSLLHDFLAVCLQDNALSFATGTFIQPSPLSN